MEYNVEVEGYYKKMMDLQEKLEKSEQDRLELEKKFNGLLRKSKDTDYERLRIMRQKLQIFIAEGKIRNERNENILNAIDRIESRAQQLAAKTQRFKEIRKEYYNCYLKRLDQSHRSAVPPHDSDIDSNAINKTNEKWLELKNYLSDTLNKEEDNYLTTLKGNENYHETILNVSSSTNEENQVNYSNDNQESDADVLDKNIKLGAQIERELELLKEPNNNSLKINENNSDLFIQNYKDIVAESEEKFGLKSKNVINKEINSPIFSNVTHEILQGEKQKISKTSEEIIKPSEISLINSPPVTENEPAKIIESKLQLQDSQEELTIIENFKLNEAQNTSSDQNEFGEVVYDKNYQNQMYQTTESINNENQKYQEESYNYENFQQKENQQYNEQKYPQQSQETSDQVSEQYFEQEFPQEQYQLSEQYEQNPAKTSEQYELEYSQQYQTSEQYEQNSDQDQYQTSEQYEQNPEQYSQQEQYSEQEFTNQDQYQTSEQFEQNTEQEYSQIEQYQTTEQYEQSTEDYSEQNYSQSVVKNIEPYQTSEHEVNSEQYPRQEYDKNPEQEYLQSQIEYSQESSEQQELNYEQNQQYQQGYEQYPANLEQEYSQEQYPVQEDQQYQENLYQSQQEYLEGEQNVDMQYQAEIEENQMDQYQYQPEDYKGEGYEEQDGQLQQSVTNENLPIIEKKLPNLAEILDTDTSESLNPDTKISNDSDFDFSNA